MSDEINNSIAAFPSSGFEQFPPQGGMTLRDYVAIHAPSEELPLPATVGEAAKANGMSVPDYIANECGAWLVATCSARYAYADAMLKARKQESH